MKKIKKNAAITNAPTKFNCEQYLVRFNIQEADGFWTLKETSYYTTGKDQHEQVEAHWRKEHSGRKVDLISIQYI